jgi:hypothetical protein
MMVVTEYDVRTAKAMIGYELLMAKQIPEYRKFFRRVAKHWISVYRYRKILLTTQEKTDVINAGCRVANLE